MLQPESTQSRSAAPGFWNTWLVLFTFLIIVFPNLPAHAQGTGDLLPEPISTLQSLDYAKRLELNDEQRSVLAAAHQEYLLQFRVLRETRIEKFLANRDVEPVGIWGALPTVRVLDNWLGRYRSLLSAIDGLERRLFAQLGEVLDDDQSDELARLQIDRERERHLQNKLVQMWLAPIGFIDFREGFRSLEKNGVLPLPTLTPEQLELIEPNLREYERVVTTKLGKLSKASREVYSIYVQMMIERGYAATPNIETSAAGETEAYFKIAVEVWYAARSKVRAVAKDIADFELATAKRLAAVLPPEAGYAVWTALASQTSAVSSDSRRWFIVDPQFEDALNRDDVSEDQRSQLRDAYLAYALQGDSVFREFADQTR